MRRVLLNKVMQYKSATQQQLNKARKLVIKIRLILSAEKLSLYLFHLYDIPGFAFSGRNIH